MLIVLRNYVAITESVDYIMQCPMCEVHAMYKITSRNTVPLYQQKIRQWSFYNILAGVPGVARDEKLRKQIFEIAWRDKGWIG